MIVAHGHDSLVQIPKHRNTGGILETTVIRHVAQRDFRDRILFEGEPIVDINPEITHKNIERDLRPRVNEDAVGVVIRMVEVKGVADAKIEPESVKLGDRPEGIHIQLRTQDHVALWRGGDQNGPRRAKEHGGSVFCEVNIVVVLDAHRGAEAELYRSELEIVGDFVNRLAAGLGCGFSGKGGPDRILSARYSRGTK